MEIEYGDRKLQKKTSDEAHLKKNFPIAEAKGFIKQRSMLKAARNLKDYRRINPRLELLTNEVDCYSVHLDARNRLKFTPKAPIPRKTDGGIDESLVTTIVITEMTDYH